MTSGFRRDEAEPPLPPAPGSEACAVVFVLRLMQCRSVPLLLRVLSLIDIGLSVLPYSIGFSIKEMDLAKCCYFVRFRLVWLEFRLALVEALSEARLALEIRNAT